MMISSPDSDSKDIAQRIATGNLAEDPAKTLKVIADVGKSWGQTPEQFGQLVIEALAYLRENDKADALRKGLGIS